LLPVGYQSSNGSVVDVALTYQSSDLWVDETVIVERAIKAMSTLRMLRAPVSFAGHRFMWGPTTAARLGYRIRRRCLARSSAHHPSSLFGCFPVWQRQIAFLLFGCPSCTRRVIIERWTGPLYRG
jgi:hypothetical protein